MSTCKLLDDHPLVPFVHAALSESTVLPKKKLHKVSGMIANALVNEPVSKDSPLGFDLDGLVVVDRGFKSSSGGRTFQLTKQVQSIEDTDNQCSGAMVTFDGTEHLVQLSMHPKSHRRGGGPGVAPGYGPGYGPGYTAPSGGPGGAAPGGGHIETAKTNEWVVEMRDMDHIGDMTLPAGPYQSPIRDDYYRIEACCMKPKQCDVTLPLCNDMMKSYASEARNLVNGNKRSGK